MKSLQRGGRGAGNTPGPSLPSKDENFAQMYIFLGASSRHAVSFHYLLIPASESDRGAHEAVEHRAGEVRWGRRKVCTEAVGGDTGGGSCGPHGQLESWLGKRWPRTRDPFSSISRPFRLLLSGLGSFPVCEASPCIRREWCRGDRPSTCGHL